MNLLDDPYPIYREMRRSHPVFRDEARRLWLLSRYDDVLNALRDPRFGSSSGGLGGDGGAVARLFSSQVELSDPPEHTRRRALLKQAFARFDHEGLARRVQGFVDDLMDQVIDVGACDFIQDLAAPLPSCVLISALELGHEPEIPQLIAEILRFVPDPTVVHEIPEEGERAARRLVALIDEMRADHGPRRPGLLGLMFAAEEEGDRLSSEELAGNLTLIFAAGRGTTTNLIGNGLLALLENPGQMNVLCERTAATATAIEEFLRYDSPIQTVARIARCRIALREFVIEEGDTVILAIGSANRDELAFPEADRLDVERARNGHLSFGAGAHFCLGAPIARLQGRIAIRTVVDRLSDIHLSPEERLSWHEGPSFRGLKALRVHFRGRRSRVNVDNDAQPEGEP